MGNSSDGLLWSLELLNFVRGALFNCEDIKGSGFLHSADSGMIEIANWVIDQDSDIDVNQILSESYHQAGVSLFNAVCGMEKTDGFSKDAHLKLVRKLLNMGDCNQRYEWRFYSWERPPSNTSPLEEQLRVKSYHECITGSHIPQTPLFHACEKGHIIALECQVFPVSVNDIKGYFNKAVIRSCNHWFIISNRNQAQGVMK